MSDRALGWCAGTPRRGPWRRWAAAAEILQCQTPGRRPQQHRDPRPAALSGARRWCGKPPSSVGLVSWIEDDRPGNHDALSRTGNPGEVRHPAPCGMWWSSRANSMGNRPPCPATCPTLPRELPFWIGSDLAVRRPTSSRPCWRSPTPHERLQPGIRTRWTTPASQLARSHRAAETRSSALQAPGDGRGALDDPALHVAPVLTTAGGGPGAAACGRRSGSSGDARLQRAPPAWPRPTTAGPDDQLLERLLGRATCDLGLLRRAGHRRPEALPPGEEHLLRRSRARWSGLDQLPAGSQACWMWAAGSAAAPGSWPATTASRCWASGISPGQIERARALTPAGLAPAALR
jgi:hypothetical protein